MGTGPVATHHGIAAQQPENLDFFQNLYFTLIFFDQSHVLASVGLGAPPVAYKQVCSDCSSCKPLLQLHL